MQKKGRTGTGPLGFFSSALCFLFTLSLMKALLSYFRGTLKTAFEPLAPPLWGVDLYSFIDRFANLHRPEFFGRYKYPWYYPAPSAWLYWLIYRIPGGWQVAYWLCVTAIVAALVAGGIFLAWALQRRGVAKARLFVFSTFVLSFPVYISLQRGNIESFIWLILAVAIWAFRREHWYSAALLIGFAAAFKIYPLIYLALFIPRKLWKPVVVGVGMMIGLTSGALRFLEPDIKFAARQTATCVRQFTIDYGGTNSRGQRIYDHSLFELLKTLLRTHDEVIPHWIGPYLLGAAAVALIVYFVRVIRLPVTNQIVFLVVASVFLPPVSFEYTLQSLLIPWAWIALLVADDGWIWATMGLFAFELAPITFVAPHGLSIGGFLKSFGLLALCAIAAIVPMDRQAVQSLQRRPETNN